MGGHYFVDSFLKLAGNEYCSRQENEFRFQVICTPNISYFLEFLGYFNLKLF